MNRRVVSTLALLSLAAAPLGAQAFPGMTPYATYVFQGCLQSVSCHTATVSLFHNAEFASLSEITIDVFSYYLQPSAGISFYDIFPITNDPDLTGVATFCTLGPRRESVQTYAASTYVPQQLSLSIDTCNEPETFGRANLTLVNSFTATPEPASLALLAPPALGLIGLRSRRKAVHVRLS